MAGGTHFHLNRTDRVRRGFDRLFFGIERDLFPIVFVCHRLRLACVGKHEPKFALYVRPCGHVGNGQRAETLLRIIADGAHVIGVVIVRGFIFEFRRIVAERSVPMIRFVAAPLRIVFMLRMSRLRRIFSARRKRKNRGQRYQ